MFDPDYPIYTDRHVVAPSSSGRNGAVFAICGPVSAKGGGRVSCFKNTKILLDGKGRCFVNRHYATHNSVRCSQNNPAQTGPTEVGSQAFEMRMRYALENHKIYQDPRRRSP